MRRRTSLGTVYENEGSSPGERISEQAWFDAHVERMMAKLLESK